MLLVLNKPFDVLSQFTPDVPGQRTLSEFALPKMVYPIGRLDRDSEGLLLLTDEGDLKAELLHPKNAHGREYWVQVEGVPNEGCLEKLREGVLVQGTKTLPARVEMLGTEALLPPRDPPVRYRKTVPTAWVSLEIHEGRNRQVRKMTAAVGFPTLRLMRRRIGQFTLPEELSPGEWRELNSDERAAVLG